LVRTIEAGDVSRPLCGRHEAGKNAHGRGFAGAIRAKECQHLTFFDAKGHPVNCGEVCVSFCNVANFDHAVDKGGWMGLLSAD
jgi:hypothetical protein